MLQLNSYAQKSTKDEFEIMLFELDSILMLH